jgi:hypothetical protein
MDPTEWFQIAENYPTAKMQRGRDLMRVIKKIKSSTSKLDRSKNYFALQGLRACQWAT